MTLIAGEINMVLPTINFSELEKFLADTHEKHINSKTSIEEKVYKQRNDREYPWHRRVLEYKGIPVYDYNNYPEIQKIFSIFDKLPINPPDRIVVMIFQSEQKPYDFNWHFDGDVEHGFRICLGLNTKVPFVRLARLKPEFEYINKTTERIYNTMVDESKQYDLYPSKENTVFILNKGKYPHMVPVKDDNRKRCVILVQGKLSAELNFEFLQRIDDEFYT